MFIGKRLACVLLVTTALTVPGAAFAQSTGTGAEGSPTDATAQQDAENLADQVTGVDDTGQEEPFEQPEISIPGGEIIVTGRRNRDLTRSSSQVVSVLSSEQIARTGEGDIAGALGRVTGLSVQGQGFVFVRGLGDRYSLALLNGLPLPSPQPLSRVVPLDIFPTSIVASSLVQKTYSVNYPGEFGGGVINLTTRAVPEERFFKISGSISGDEQTTFQSGIDYFGSDSDWTGFDNGTRDIPPALQTFFASGQRLSDPGVDQQAILRQLGNPNLILTQNIDELPANFSGGLTAGDTLDIGDARLGIVATASLSNKWRNRSIISQTAVNSELDLDTDFRDFVTDNRILVNALVGFGLEVGDHRFRFTNLFIRDTLKQSRLSLGEDFQDDDSEFQQDTAWFERQLYNAQLVGELKFGDLGIDLRGGFARTQRESPFEYNFTYVRSNNVNDPLGDTFINVLDRQTGSASVAFSDLQEDLYYGGIDVGYPVTDWLRLSAGYAYTDTDRFSTRREFLVNANTSFPDGVGALRPDLLLGDAVIDFYQIGLIESTQADPAFDAALTTHGAYIKGLIEPVLGVTIDVGVRYEDAEQTVTPVEVFAIPTNSGSATALANDYFLPAATITWEATDGLQFRVNASKTIARPQFRELDLPDLFQPRKQPPVQRQPEPGGQRTGQRRGAGRILSGARQPHVAGRVLQGNRQPDRGVLQLLRQCAGVGLRQCAQGAAVWRGNRYPVRL